MSTATKKSAAGVLKDFDKATETALYYGFTPIKTPRIEKKDMDAASALLEQKKDFPFPHDLYPRPEEKAALLRSYAALNFQAEQHPVMLFYKRPFAGGAQRRSSSEMHAGLEIIGTHGSIADAIAIKTTYAILSDYGYDNLVIDINSIGDKESIIRYERELSSWLRKQGASLPSELRQEFRQDPFSAFRSEHPEWKELKERMPESLGYLSDQSSFHFKEVLEYLEALDIPYRIKHSLIPERRYCSHTIFEIRHIESPEGIEEKTLEDNPTIGPAGENGEINDNGTIVAFGTRHNHISKRIGFKKDIPVASVNIGFKKKVEPKTSFKSGFRPKFYFIQFGNFAKLKSLPLIESLRSARIPVYHSLTKDKFVGQLSSAESIASPFVIIMGQKEALENTVVVRQMSTRSQETVPVCDLANYLSKLR